MDLEFILACKTGNMEIINLFIQKGVNINYIDKEEKYDTILLITPLSIACEKNNYELVLLLLNLGVDINPDMSKYIEDIKNSNRRRKDYKIVYKSALMYACEQKNKNIINHLINNGAVVNEKNLEGKSIFMYVCEIGDIKNVQFLMNNKHCNITDEDNKSNNVLHHLCGLDENKDNYIEIVEYLLNTNKFDLEKQNNKGETALYIASNCNNNKIVRLLIEHGAEINTMKSPLLKNINKTSNLEMAEYVISKGIYLNNHLLVWDAYELKLNDMIKLFIKNGMDLYISDTQYEELLKLIIINTDIDILPYLMPYYKLYKCNLYKYGEDAFFKNSTLSSAIKNQNIKIIKHLMKTNIYHIPNINKYSFNYVFENYDYELCLACRVGNIEIIKLLIEKGACINCICSNIITPLIMASKYDHLEVVKFLLNNGAQINPNIANKYKYNYKSALIYACEQGHLSIVKYFVQELKCNINEKDINKKSIFMYACKNGNEALIQFMIKKGCNLTDEDISGNNALHYIVQSNVSQNKPEIMELLMNTNKYDLNQQNKDGETVLHIAIKFNNIQVFNYLIYHYEAKININILTFKNYTPLIYACIYGHLKIVKALVVRHCDINIKERSGKSALTFSIEKGHLDIAYYLITNCRNEIIIDLFFFQ